MPRDGSNIYSQPFPDVVEDTTIESTVYNGFTNDVAQDLNAPRPIVAGGTGATSANDARFNLATEAATQVVTNYDSHLWVPGSFRSTSSADGAPVASHAFGGWCYIGEALANPPTNQNVVVHAFDFDALANTSLLYTRQKKAGVWSDWNITTTEDNQAGARQAIYAAPLDALAYNGMQINGSMDVSQETGTGGIGSSQYVVDGWLIMSGGGITATIGGSKASASSDFPGLFQNLIYISNSTTQASIPAGGYVLFRQYMEGYRVARLNWGTANAQPLTIGFWVKNNKAGTYSVSVSNSPVTRTYVSTYTQDVAATAEYKTITIPGDTAGTWASDNSTGLFISFVMAAGSTHTAPLANTWTAGSYLAAPGQVNGIDVVNACRLTGVVVLPGLEAPSSARSPLIMRPYDQELLTCMRYYEKGTSPQMYRTGGTFQAGIIQVYDTMRFSAIKRASPTITFSGWQYYNTSDVPTAVTPIVAVASFEMFSFAGVGMTNFKAWHPSGNWFADARL